MTSYLHVLQRDFYMKDAVTVARALLGALLVSESPEGRTAGRIVETEAYAGYNDAACHSYKRKTALESHRTNIMFGCGGHAYVYLIYGMYNCFNVVANAQGEPEAVLIRALEPLEGIELMAKRRGTDMQKNLCSGPGKLCMAMGITLADYGADLCCGERLFIAQGDFAADEDVRSTPRINVDYAGEASGYPYRFVIADSRFLSTRRFLNQR